MQRDQVLERIHNCELVLKELEQSKIWKILSEDLEMQRVQLDANWQTVKASDDFMLQEMRVHKLAVMHILNLPDIYKKHLENAQQALEEMDDTENTVAKDYDMETNIEKGEPKGGDYGSR